MNRLFYNYYITKNQDRRNEIDFCIKENLLNAKVAEIIVLIENKNIKLFSEKDCVKDNKSKIKIIEENAAITYASVFNLIESLTQDDDVNIIVNSDIFLDPDSMDLLTKLDRDSAWCLSRWDIFNKKMESKLRDVSCSQDTWIIKGKPKKMDNINFNFGRAGCDNRICYELDKAGYKVSNPAKSFITYHYHLSNARDRYGNNNTREKHRIKGGYKFLDPIKI